MSKTLSAAQTDAPLPIKLEKSVNKTQCTCESWRANGHTVGFVPTMGCLHDGHMALIRRARESCDKIVVSIFVNPKQFGKNEDLGSYPRTFEEDTKKCEEAGVDLIFHPAAEEIYSEDFITKVTSGPLGQLYCGKSRPVFFDGILTVVSILFNIVRPHFAFFGEKDFQQLFLIKKLVEDLRFVTTIVGVPLVREADGLAMSSRNEYLTSTQRKQALCLSRSLLLAKEEFSKGDSDVGSLVEKAKAVLKGEPDFELDYLYIIDENSLQPLSKVEGDARILAAGYLGNNPRIRLIDNMRIK